MLVDHRGRPIQSERRFRTERAFVPPNYRYSRTRTGIAASAQQPNPRVLLTEGFGSTAATAARAVANRASDLVWQVEEETTNEQGEMTWEAVPTHPLQELLDQPNPILTHRQLMKLTSYWLSQTGEAYWVIVWDGAGNPTELWPLPPDQVEKVSGDAVPVGGFVHHEPNGETRYTLEETVWIYDPDPADPWAGVGVLGPQALTFDAEKFGEETTRQHFQDDATPKVVLAAEAEADAPDSDARDAFARDWTNRYSRRGGSSHGIPAFLPSGFRLEQMDQASNLEEIKAYLEFARDNLLMAYGVPRSILGDVVDANRAAAETNQFVFDRHSITPQAGLVSDAVTLQLAGPYYEEGIRAVFAPFVSEDEDLRLREEAQDLEQAVRSINQVRADRGLDEVEWGEDPKGTFGDQPYRPNEDDDPDSGGDPGLGEPGPPSGDTVPDEDLDSEDGERSRIRPSSEARSRILARFSPEASWARQIADEARYLPRIQREIRAVFASQRAALLAELEALGEVPPTTRSYARADWLDELFARPDFERMWEVRVTPLTTDLAVTAGGGTLAALEDTGSISFTARDERALADRGAEMIKSVNQTTKNRIRDTLIEGISQGESLEQLTSRIRSVYRSATRSRARTIAQTETTYARTVGERLAYSESAVVDRMRWVTALDDRVRDQHRSMHGQVRAVNGGSFMLPNGEEALGPNMATDGGRLSAANGINCRCRLLPVLEGD